MTIGILTSPNLWNCNSICVRNPKFLSVSSTNTFAHYFESHWRETWRYTGTRAVSYGIRGGSATFISICICICVFLSSFTFCFVFFVLTLIFICILIFHSVFISIFICVCKNLQEVTGRTSLPAWNLWNLLYIAPLRRLLSGILQFKIWTMISLLYSGPRYCSVQFMFSKGKLCKLSRTFKMFNRHFIQFARIPVEFVACLSEMSTQKYNNFSIAAVILE